MQTTSQKLSLMNMKKMMKKQTLLIFLLVANLTLAFSASAQTPPDAGQLLRDLQREPAVVPRPAVPVISIEGEEDEVAAGAVRFAVKTVRVTGATVFPAVELETLVADLVGEDKSLADLQAAARRITGYYRERGYPVARAHVPAQEIRDGAVTLAVLEGQLGRKLLDNRSNLRDERVHRYLSRVGEGKIITAAPLNRALLLIADTPGVGDVRATLRPGDRVGTSDLTVKIVPGPRYAGELAVDNYGNRFTGQHRLSGRLEVNNPVGLGDRLRLRAIVSDEQLLYGRLAWDALLGASGLRLGGAYTASRYELAEDFAHLGAHGTAYTASLYGVYPLLRSLNANVYAGLSLEDRRLKDRIDTLGVNIDRHAKAAVLNFTGDFIDNLGGGAANSWQLAATVGDLSIDSPAQLAIDRATARTHGGYSKITANFTRLQTLPRAFSAYLALSGQLAGKNLDSSEKFVLGGAYGVRAYPQGEAVGDNGLLATAELRYNFLPNLQGTVFYDAGWVEINHRPFAAGDNTRNIAGYGIGANAAFGAFNLRTSIAWRDTAAPISDRDRTPRLWVQGSWSF